MRRLLRSSLCLLGPLAAGFTIAACGSSGGSKALPPAATCSGTAQTATEMSSVASVSENVDTTCAAVVGYETWMMGATGSACGGPLDCTPVCCPCPNGTHHTLAGWCNQGFCAAPADVACMIAGTPGLAGCSN